MTIVERLLRLDRRHKRALAIAADAVACILATWAAYYLRLEEWVFAERNEWMPLLGSVAIALPIFIRFGLYRTIFRHTGWPAITAVARACLLYGIIYATVFTFISVPHVPRAVGLLQPVLLLLLIAATRGTAHYLLSGGYRRMLGDDAAERVMVYGAGATGRQIVEVLRTSRSMKAVGFFDDDRSLHGALVQGLQVNDPRQLVQVCARHEISTVLLALPSATRRRRRQIVELLIAAGIKTRTLTGLAEMAKGDVHINDIRPVQIEDLLGRDPVEPDAGLLTKTVQDRVVMITGGGGSIGSELCRQIVALRPSKLVIVDISEYALYSIHQELRQLTVQRGDPVSLVPLIASVQDIARLRAIMAAHRPQTIYHAAAYKHVPLVEDNPIEGVKNNVFGTLTVADLALEFSVRDFVLISTDKAVRPTNVMGATKRLSEMVLQAQAAEKPPTRFSMVRFGNVLGSSGSVVPLFRGQIASGGPITITHPDVTRYFMTIPEAAQLVIQASAMAEGGDVFLLDMGEPVKIYDMAVAMVELSGLKIRDESNPDGDIEITVIGLRPGEKLYEELLIGGNPAATAHQRIMRGSEDFVPLAQLRRMLARLQSAADDGDEDEVQSLLRAFVPEYRSDIPDLRNDRSASQSEVIAFTSRPADFQRQVDQQL